MRYLVLAIFEFFSVILLFGQNKGTQFLEDSDISYWFKDNNSIKYEFSPQLKGRVKTYTMTDLKSNELLLKITLNEQGWPLTSQSTYRNDRFSYTTDPTTGNITSLNESVPNGKLVYNSDLRLIESWRNKNGHLYTYTADGLYSTITKLEENYEHPEAEPDSAFLTLYKYEKGGSIIKEEYMYRQGIREIRNISVFDKHGYLSAYEEHEEYNYRRVYNNVYTYYPNGMIKTRVAIEEKDETKVYCEYDERGNRTLREEFGKGKTTPTYREVKAYDKEGNVVAEKIYKNGELTQNTKRKYKNGELTKETTYDSADKVISTKDIPCEFDKQGNLIKNDKVSIQYEYYK